MIYLVLLTCILSSLFFSEFLCCHVGSLFCMRNIFSFLFRVSLLAMSFFIFPENVFISPSFLRIYLLVIESWLAFIIPFCVYRLCSAFTVLLTMSCSCIEISYLSVSCSPCFSFPCLSFLLFCLVYMRYLFFFSCLGVLEFLICVDWYLSVLIYNCYLFIYFLCFIFLFFCDSN